MSLDAPELPPEYAPKVKAQAAALQTVFKKQRAYAKALRKAEVTPLADHVEHSLWQEPPNRAGALPYKCAAEAFFLMEQFSLKKLTGTEDGPFLMIAAKLYEAVTGKREADMRRACHFVLENRRRYPRNDPTPPPIPPGHA